MENGEMSMYTSTEIEWFNKLQQAVVDMEEDDAISISKQIIEQNVSIKGAIEEGLIKGMERVSELYEEEQYFIPDLLMCADAMYAGLDVLKEKLNGEVAGCNKKVVIGTVLGDTHDIGKNIVACFLDSAGFNVYDIGRDIPADIFVQKAIEYNADIIVLSTIMTTTMENMRTVIEELKKQNVRDRFKVMVGGKPISPKFAKEIGADGYSVNAAGAIRLAKKLAGVEDI